MLHQVVSCLRSLAGVTVTERRFAQRHGVHTLCDRLNSIALHSSVAQRASAEAVRGGPLIASVQHAARMSAAGTVAVFEWMLPQQPLPLAVASGQSCVSVPASEGKLRRGDASLSYSHVVPARIQSRWELRLDTCSTTPLLISVRFFVSIRTDTRGRRAPPLPQPLLQSFV
jgi:hypothetical protein